MIIIIIILNTPKINLKPGRTNSTIKERGIKEARKCGHLVWERNGSGVWQNEGAMLVEKDKKERSTQGNAPPKPLAGKMGTADFHEFQPGVFKDCCFKVWHAWL